jgi:hypothetical protein
MADLLECLIQIKALWETIDKAARLAAPGGVDAWWGALADAERRYAATLRAAAPALRRDSPPPPAGVSERDEFVRLRRANLALLGRCTAAQLAGPVDWPGRRGTTVADLVAIMLAADTVALGELRRVSPGPWPQVPGA